MTAAQPRASACMVQPAPCVLQSRRCRRPLGPPAVQGAGPTGVRTVPSGEKEAAPVGLFPAMLPR